MVIQILKSVLLGSIICLAVNGTSQTRYRVNNTGVSADFTTLSDAVTAASPSDILIIEHSDFRYNSAEVNINKELTLYGTGYFLEDNDSTQADIRTSKLGTINITADNVTVSGLTADTIRINADNVIVERCLILEHIVIGDDGATAASPTVRQCFIQGSADELIKVENASSMVFSNNYCENENATGTNNMVMESGTSGLVLNSLFFGDPDNIFLNSTVANNYFEASEIDTINSSNITVQNNFAEGGFLETYQGTSFINSFAPDTMFQISSEPSRDVRFELRPSVSPGLNDGTDGTDVGMFGGSYPYEPSGMPPIPSVWFYNGEPTGTEGSNTNVEVKSKSRK